MNMFCMNEYSTSLFWFKLFNNPTVILQFYGNKYSSMMMWYISILLLILIFIFVLGWLKGATYTYVHNHTCVCVCMCTYICVYVCSLCVRYIINTIFFSASARFSIFMYMGWIVFSFNLHMWCALLWVSCWDITCYM